MRWKFAKGDSNRYVCIPHVTISCPTQPPCLHGFVWREEKKSCPRASQSSNKYKTKSRQLHTINNDFITNMKCCIDVISLILYHLMAVMPSVLALRHSRLITWKPEGGIDCKMFFFVVFFLHKEVSKMMFFLFLFFFNSKLKYTGVPLHICTDVSRKRGKTTRGG